MFGFIAVPRGYMYENSGKTARSQFDLPSLFVFFCLQNYENVTFSPIHETKILDIDVWIKIFINL